ncbi:MAG: hypothetical protein L0J17_04330 [Brevibacterium sp.]|nr:hypothetical protein [Brevibacterium sp.]MDN5909704.1 hypothetical protein [Brevibacterium sp.]MDN6174605.1 hypothetical protein [Brevibacterium sp.]MDN6188244.1 hypothetical protein [Brevibacterium sp.]MDN6192344.1 hypothetical protein [Brevibacterium sp.]
MSEIFRHLDDEGVIMKFMLIMRDIDQAAVDAAENTDFEEIIAVMGAYNESMINAGVFSDAAGLSGLRTTSGSRRNRNGLPKGHPPDSERGPGERCGGPG